MVICRGGRTTELMAIDIGARLVAFDAEGVIVRVEPAAKEMGRRIGVDVRLGAYVSGEDLRRLAAYMVDHLVNEVRVGGVSVGSHLLRTQPLEDRRNVAAITFSGGVSEYVYGRAEKSFGDLGPLLAQELRTRDLGAPIEETPGGIRATVIGASQYTIQVSGSTIFLSPLDVVPVRNIPVVMPHFPWHEDEFTSATVADVIRDALRRFDLLDASSPVALAAHWEGSATYSRIKTFCSGAVDAMQSNLANHHPLILVFDSDIGGLLGLHLRE